MFLNLSSATQRQVGNALLFAIGSRTMVRGQVEKNVQDARNRMWQIMPVFKDLDELNQWLEDRCIALWVENSHRDLPETIADAWEAEKPMLMALPPAFDGLVEHSKRVSPTIARQGIAKQCTRGVFDHF